MKKSGRQPRKRLSGLREALSASGNSEELIASASADGEIGAHGSSVSRTSSCPLNGEKTDEDRGGPMRMSLPEVNEAEGDADLGVVPLSQSEKSKKSTRKLGKGGSRSGSRKTDHKDSRKSDSEKDLENQDLLEELSNLIGEEIVVPQPAGSSSDLPRTVSLSSLHEDDDSASASVGFHGDSEEEASANVRHSENLAARLNTLELSSSNRVGLTRKVQRLSSSGHLIRGMGPGQGATDSNSFSEFRLADLEVLTDDEFDSRFEVKVELGAGATCTVLAAYDRVLKRDVALKIMARELLERHEELLREVDILRELKHPGIVSALECISTPDSVFIVMELVDGEELFDAICARKHYSELDARQIMQQLCDAVAYMHDCHIAHRDLKPENVLILNKGGDEANGSHNVVKIVDFGLARRFRGTDGGMSTPAGTLGFKAPELFEVNSRYDRSVDLWALGVLTYIILAGFPPFLSRPDDANDLDQSPFWFLFNRDTPELRKSVMESNVKFPSPYWDEISQEARNFCTRLLCKSSSRMTASEALKHPWFASRMSVSNTKRINLQETISKLGLLVRKAHSTPDLYSKLPFVSDQEIPGESFDEDEIDAFNTFDFSMWFADSPREVLQGDSDEGEEIICRQAKEGSSGEEGDVARGSSDSISENALRDSHGSTGRGSGRTPFKKSSRRRLPRDDEAVASADDAAERMSRHRTPKRSSSRRSKRNHTSPKRTGSRVLKTSAPDQLQKQIQTDESDNKGIQQDAGAVAKPSISPTLKHIKRSSGKIRPKSYNAVVDGTLAEFSDASILVAQLSGKADYGEPSRTSLGPNALRRVQASSPAPFLNEDRRLSAAMHDVGQMVASADSLVDTPLPSPAIVKKTRRKRP